MWQPLLIGFAIGLLVRGRVSIRISFPRRASRVPVVQGFDIQRPGDLANFGVPMDATIGKPLALAVVNVKTAAGDAVDLSVFPTALSGLTWTVSDAALASVNTTQPDGLKAELVGIAEGDVTVTASGANVAGETVSQTQVVTVKKDVPVVASFEIAAA